MTENKRRTTSRSFDKLRGQVDADPARRERVETYKTAMLSELRRELDLTQVALAERLEVTQENVSQIERGEVDLRVSTLTRYVEALGGRLEVRATFPDRTVELRIGTGGTVHRRRKPAKAS